MVNQVGSPAMFDGNMFLPETGTAHLEDGAHQDGVGGLDARAVDGGDLDAEIVDDRLTPGALFGAVHSKFSCGHQYPLLTG